jgi:hypothetical protein
MKKITLLLSCLLASALSAQAADTPPRNRTIPTVTLLVKTFSTIEGTMLDAAAAKDANLIGQMLADRFELRSAQAPAQPVPRDEFIAQLVKDGAFAGRVTQMATHEFGEVVQVSFMIVMDAVKTTPLASKIFVVDTWKRVEGNWQLQVRYAAPADTSGKRVPGAAALAIDSKKKI